MKTPQGDTSGRPRLFEVNLIQDRVNRLRRRMAMAKCGAAASLCMLVIAGILGMRAAAHLTRAIRIGFGIRRISAELQSEKEFASELDARRTAALEKLGEIVHLVPIAQARVAWAPKLRVLGENLLPGMGVAMVNADSGDLFTRDAAAQGNQQDVKLPAMTFSVMYVPSASRSADPVGELLARLRTSKKFMHKMGLIRVEETEQEVWEGRQIILFRGLLKGAAVPDET